MNIEETESEFIIRQKFVKYYNDNKLIAENYDQYLNLFHQWFNTLAFKGKEEYTYARVDVIGKSVLKFMGVESKYMRDENFLKM